ncbi:MAG: 3-hydroxyacyl-CoA dehydrogenase [Bacteroidetes bacterium]|nr:3-hydroxyacyl-CoA dehydrogenase [Bacteroidota bacterium]
MRMEDFKDYDAIFDLNFDDDPSNFPLYASLRDKPIFTSAVKMSLNELVYTSELKVKCKLFGINALPTFLNQGKWEISAYRKFQIPDLVNLMKALSIDYLPVEDRVGMVKPRVIFMLINEACYALQGSTATMEDIDLSMKLGTNYPFGPFEWSDKIGLTHVFETLAALYEDTKDERYKISPLLKAKYMRNESFYRNQAKK